MMCCAGLMLLACIGNSLWQLVLEMSIFASQKPVLLLFVFGLCFTS